MRIDLTPTATEQPASHPGEIGDPTMAFLAALVQFLPPVASEPASTPDGEPGIAAAPVPDLPVVVAPPTSAPLTSSPLTAASLTAAGGLTLPTGTASVAAALTQSPDGQSAVLTPVGPALAGPVEPAPAVGPPSGAVGGRIVAAVLQTSELPAALVTQESRPVVPALVGVSGIKAAPTESPEQHLTAPLATVDPEPAALVPTVALGRRIEAPATPADTPAGELGADPIAGGAEPDVLRSGATSRAGQLADRRSEGTEAIRSATAQSAEPVLEPVGLAAVVSLARPDSTSAAVAAGSVAERSAPQVASQLAPYVAALRHGPDGSHHISVLLHPAELGQVQVVVELRAGTVNLALSGAHEAARDALLGALPALRRELTDAGLTVGRTDVLAQDPGTAGGATSGGHPGAGNRPAPGTWSSDRAVPSPSAQLAPEPLSPPNRRASHAGAVDVTI